MNKVALVTGAASGIGRATALLLAQEGASVAVTDIDPPGAKDAAEEIASQGGQAAWWALDVTSEQSWEKVTEQVLERWGRLEIAVNNTGISLAKPVTEMSLAAWRQVIAVNLDGVFLGTQTAVRAMRKGKGGSIINVSSASGIRALTGASAYCASKAAVRLFSKAVALECAQGGYTIRVNRVLPGGVITPMWEKQEWWPSFVAEHGGTQAAWAHLAESALLKRLAEPKEIARAVLYLASDDASYVTGADLVIDGGYTA